MRRRLTACCLMLLIARAVSAGDNAQMFGQILGGIMGGGNQNAAANQQNQQGQQPQGVAQALSILQALQGGGQAQGAQGAPAQNLSTKDALKAALLQQLVSGERVDLKQLAGQALASKVAGGGDTKDALKAALLQKLISGERLDVQQLAGQALAAKMQRGGGDSTKEALKAALLQKLVSGERLDLQSLAGTAIESKLGSRLDRLGGGGLGGGAAAAPRNIKERLEDMLLERLVTGERIDVRSMAGQIMAEKARDKASRIAADGGDVEAKQILKYALMQELMGRTGLAEAAAPPPSGYGAALRSPEPVPSGSDRAQVDALLQQYGVGGGAGGVPPGHGGTPPGHGGTPPGRSGPTFPGGRGASGGGGGPRFPGRSGAPAGGSGPRFPGRSGAPARGGGPTFPGSSGRSALAARSSDSAQVQSLLDQYQVAPGSAPQDPPSAGRSGPSFPGSSGRRDRRRAGRSRRPRSTPTARRAAETSVGSPALQARLAKLRRKRGPSERIRIPLETLPSAPPDQASRAPVPAPAAAPTVAPAAAPALQMAGIDVGSLERTNPEAARALSQFTPEVLRAAAALLEAQRQGAAPEPPPRPASRRRTPEEPARASAVGPNPRVAEPPRGASRLASLRARLGQDSGPEAASPPPSPADQEQLREEIEEWVRKEKGITRFSKREEKMRAEVLIESMVEDVLAGELGWPLEDDQVPGRSQGRTARRQRRVRAGREYTVKEKMALTRKIREEIYSREGIDRFSNRAARTRADAMVETMVTQAMEDGSAMEYLDD